MSSGRVAIPPPPRPGCATLTADLTDGLSGGRRPGAVRVHPGRRDPGPAPRRTPIRPGRSSAPPSTRSAVPMRWVVVAGEVDPGRGPCDPAERTGVHRAPASASPWRPRGASGSPSSAAIRPTDELLDGAGAAARRAARRPDRPPARDRLADPRRRAAPVGGRRTTARQPGDDLGRGRSRPPALDRRAGARRAHAARPGDHGRLMTDPILVLAWLVLAHLVADFVLQTGCDRRRQVEPRHAGRPGPARPRADRRRSASSRSGSRSARRGWWFVAIAGVSHVGIDRTKVVLTRRAAAAALREAHDRHEGPPAAGASRPGVDARDRPPCSSPIRPRISP